MQQVNSISTLKCSFEASFAKGCMKSSEDSRILKKLKFGSLNLMLKDLS